MAADGFKATTGEGFAPVDPYALARSEAAAAQIRRFYKDAATVRQDGGFAVLLDGRTANTPKRRPILLPSEGAAALVVAEFEAQGQVMKPGEMPVLRLVNSIIDGVADTRDAVAADVLRYASADMILYRADGPPELVERQAREWDGVLAWARDRLGARFYLAEGVIHVTQPDHALAAAGAAIAAFAGAGGAMPFRLGALHVMTTLTGSALLALAVLAGELSKEEAWRKAHLDEDFQAERWGRDDEAEARRHRRWRDMRAASDLVDALGRSISLPGEPVAAVRR